ncbi:MAG: excinuclease ABC subunit UvrC, partial [Desulfobacterales bacterium]|nr:excinuclease ABC subunit UvrC [Desulfobacterales bacterium]
MEAYPDKKLAAVSSMPGVYIMKDAGGKVVYVGKAGNLHKRISSYFMRPAHQADKTRALVKKISSFETIITKTEKEALILESTLIKQYKPRYNVILKDDKQYPCLCLNINQSYPSLSIVRKIKKDGSIYFGPFTSAGAVRQTLNIINKTFKLRKCKTKEFKNRSRPCLNFQIKSCLAPCCLNVDKNAYDEMVKEVIQFLKGKTPVLINKMKKEMSIAAEALEFERAAELRDKISALEKTLEKQVAVSTDFIDRDILGIAVTDGLSIITLLFIRGGCLFGMRHFSFSETILTDAELIGSFIRQYYEKSPFIPGEILVPISLEDAFLLEDWLYSIKGKKVSIIHPKHGEKVDLTKMASLNAENRLKEQIAFLADEIDLLARLQKRLKMDRLPKRIECFDNSNISGKEPVAGMVVFEQAKPEKSSYRKYRIKGVFKPDDYACMYEVLKRRYAKPEESMPYPDALLVDGGKGQLSIALTVIKELKLEGKFSIIGIAKKDKKRGEITD